MSEPLYYANEMADGRVIKSRVPFPSAVTSTPVMDLFDVFENEEHYRKWIGLFNRIEATSRSLSEPDT